jgi:RNA polymerase sigma-70 factor (ECF subfamily)
MKNHYDTRGRWLAEHVLPHEPGLRSWLRRLAKLSDADVDDLIQETYANLFTRPSVAEIADPRAYTYQVARSILLQNLRRAKIVTIEAVADVSSLNVAATAPSAEELVEGYNELQRVTDAIEAMPPQTRRAFWMRRVEGMSQRQVAQALNLSENTVEKHIMRGIRLLMDRFGRGGKPPRQASMTHAGNDVEQGTQENDEKSRISSEY